MSQTHVVVQGSERAPLPGAVATGPANANATIEVTLKLRRKEALPAITGRPKDTITHAQLADRYGASDADIQKVVEVLGKFGLKQSDVNQGARSIRLQGTISSMEEAFQVKLFNYAHTGGTYRGRVGSVQIPAELQGIVQGVFGLDNRQVARRKRHIINDDSHTRQASVPSAWYVSSELASHYNFPAGNGKGQTVGILEFGGGYFPNDLKKFCSLAKIAAPPQVTPVSTDGSATDSKDGAEGEVMLDVEVVAGVCPEANIVVYFANWSDEGWITNLDAAIQDTKNNPGVISVSWGNPEDTGIWTTQAMDQTNESLQDAISLGITICIAAGDDGSSDAVGDGLAHVDFPSSSPYVLAVGGTTIPTKGGSQPDIAWKEGSGLRATNGGSTGGGVSAVFPRPTWQSSVNITSVNPGSIVGRCVPDLAANADWNVSPYLLVVDGKSQPNGGTSAATPLMASLLTLINATRPANDRVGYLTPVLYQTNGGTTIGAAGCIDVTSGNNVTDKNGGYNAGPGYDAVSGWGTPNGQKLAAVIPQ
jgi:kumamolisin